MKTLQELLDERVAAQRAAALLLDAWQNDQPAREARAEAEFRSHLMHGYGIAIGDDALLSAHEARLEPGARNRWYEMHLTFPALEATVQVRFDRNDHGNWYCPFQVWIAYQQQARKTFETLIDALLWITDNGQTALSGAPVAVTPSEYQEA